MASPDRTDERLQSLESAVAHLQYDFEQLNQVLLALQGDLRIIGQRLTRVDHRLSQLGDPAEERSPEDERPPHY